MNNTKDNSSANTDNTSQIVSGLIPAFLSFAVAFYGYNKGQDSVHSLIVAGTGLISTTIILWLVHMFTAKAEAAKADAWLREKQAQEEYKRQNALAEARLKAEKSNSFDYKMYAPIGSSSVSALLQAYNWNLDPEKNGPVNQIDAQDKRYIKLEVLLADTVYGRDFQCLPVRNEDKWEKCIIQVSFIPTDKNGNIPLILRMPYAHARDVVLQMENPIKAKFTFVSFSPVPIRYNKKFDYAICYQREVPNRIDRSQYSFDEIGCAMKYESKDGKRRLYLFYVIAVHYPTISFVDEKGALDLDVIRQLFAVDPNAPSEELKCFRKDHDVIIAATTPNNIYNAFSRDGNRKALPESLRSLLDNTDYVVKSTQRDVVRDKNEIFEDHFDLLNGKLGEVELAHIQRMRTRRG